MKYDHALVPRILGDDFQAKVARCISGQTRHFASDPNYHMKADSYRRKENALNDLAEQFQSMELDNPYLCILQLVSPSDGHRFHLPL